MIILGLYCGHDSNACILRDGKVLAHVESERVTRRKHEAGLIRGAVQAALDAAGISLNEVDVVAVGGSTWAGSIDPWPQLGEVIRTPLQSPNTTAFLNGGIPTLSFNLGVPAIGRPVPIHIVHHHISHAALAYYTCPWPEVTVMSWDGGGDGAYNLRCRGVGGKLVEIAFHPPTGKLNLSIGGIWTEVGAMYGLGVDHEGKIMGHASYGTIDAALVAKLRNWMQTYQANWCAKPWATDLMRTIDFSDLLSTTSMGLSASLQRATEDLMVEMVANVHGPLALTGGCAYNCVANGRIFQQHPEVYVPSCPHDGGLAMGAALYVWHHVLGNSYAGQPKFSPYLGSGTWKADKSVAESVVADLLAGKIVAWYDGPAESGKRALGARSILVDPRNPAIKDIINQRIKHREWFRPFAPSVLPNRGEWCDGPLPPSAYMSFSCRVREEWRNKIPGVVHVDGTCRPQIVHPELNPVYHEIIRLFDEATGIPMILNTSFNVNEPIVNTPEQAHATFAKVGIDVLYLHGERFTKPA